MSYFLVSQAGQRRPPLLLVPPRVLETPSGSADADPTLTPPRDPPFGFLLPTHAQQRHAPRQTVDLSLRHIVGIGDVSYHVGVVSEEKRLEMVAACKRTLQTLAPEELW